MGQDHAGTEHVDEQRGEEHRLDGDIGQLQRLARDVHQVASGEHGDVAQLADKPVPARPAQPAVRAGS